MAIGTITTPVTWLNGTIDSPTWNQNVQDTLNNVYATKGYIVGTQSVWLSPAEMLLGGNWALSEFSAGAFSAHCSTAAGAGSVGMPIKVPFVDASHYVNVTRVDLRINKASTGTTTLTVAEESRLSTFGGAPNTTGVANATSSSSGHQWISISGLTLRQKADSLIYAYVNAANDGDDLYALQVTFDLSTIS